MGRGTYAVGRVIDCARLGLCGRDEFGHGLHIEGRRRDENHWHIADQCDGFEVGQYVVRQFVLQERKHRNAVISEHQRVAVGRGLGHCIDSNHPTAPGFVVHHDRLPPQSRKTGSYVARDHVDRSAGWERDYQLDRSVRVTALCDSRRCHAGKGGCQQRGQRAVHRCTPPAWERAEEEEARKVLVFHVGRWFGARWQQVATMQAHLVRIRHGAEVFM